MYSRAGWGWIWLFVCITSFVFGLRGESLESLTAINQLNAVATAQPQKNFQIRLEGDVWWVNTKEDWIVLHDDTGTEQIELELNGQTITNGQHIVLARNGTITKSGRGVRIGSKGPVVDNNGIHGMIEKAGMVFLEEGRQPIRLKWFNGVEKSGLTIEYEGPELPRQRIGEESLSHTNERGVVTPGLSFKSYDVNGEVLPDFRNAKPIAVGAVKNFDASVVHKATHAGLEFEGWITIARAGLYTFYLRSDDGSELYIGRDPLQFAVTGIAKYPAPRRIVIGQTMNDDDDCVWGTTEGTVTFVNSTAAGLTLELGSATGRMCVEVRGANGLSAAQLLNRRIRATGVCRSAITVDGQQIAGTFLVASGAAIEITGTDRDIVTSTNVIALPALTTGAEVHHLKREEAERGYPVKLRGVITSVLPEHQAFTLQDSTRGLYVVNVSTNGSLRPEIGDFLEIEGATDPSLFAPIVNASNINLVSGGRLPEPLHPTWDQLLNGSLDAQYVELQGIITTIGTNGVTLLTREGRINLELRVVGFSVERLAEYEDALVRIRGCLFASWDYVTHKVKIGEIRIYGATISVDQPAPVDLFAIAPKTAAELLLFDPQAGVFQRVKVRGQILCKRDGEYFMADGASGLHFIAKKNADVETGDLVEVVGFPELSGASPLLREAVVRKRGHEELPEAKELATDDLIRADYDATRVKIRGSLTGLRQTQPGQVLEIQSGVRTFAARLDSATPAENSLPIGSVLELTGVYAGQGGNKAIGQDISSFELLVQSPADIHVLARPPWWTLERLLIIVGALVCVLVVTALWITQLHRKVEERTRQLEAQIRERQVAEQQRAMERERARVAHDLHDELGSGLTEISMLVTVAKSAVSSDSADRQLEQIGDRAGQMVTALDEIVWAMNPKHDTLASLVSYSCLYADRFLKLANINCRLKGGVDLPDRMVNAACRHEFFLAFKEALNNVVRHSRASEVRLGVQMIGERLRLSIADNGSGLASNTFAEGSDGLANMRTRLEKMGGRFVIASKAGRGTTLRFYMPLN